MKTSGGVLQKEDKQYLRIQRLRKEGRKGGRKEGEKRREEKKKKRREREET